VRESSAHELLLIFMKKKVIKCGDPPHIWFPIFREGGGSHGWLKYFLLKILFLPKILKRYFLPKYLRDPFLSGSDERFSPWWLSLQILYNERFPWRRGRGIENYTKLMIS
jgi:hypothetical protein